jgi:hypothetical protein
MLHTSSQDQGHVHFKEPAKDNEQEMNELLLKMHGLSVKEQPYTLLYAQCIQHYPELTLMLPKLEFGHDVPTFTVGILEC